jgi:hypothetical protein
LLELASSHQLAALRDHADDGLADPYRWGTTFT